MDPWKLATLILRHSDPKLTTDACPATSARRPIASPSGLRETPRTGEKGRALSPPCPRAPRASPKGSLPATPTPLKLGAQAMRAIQDSNL